MTNSKKKKKTIKPTKEKGLSVFLRSPQFALVRGVFYMLLALFSVVAILAYVAWLIAADSDIMSYRYADNLCGSVGGWLAVLMVRSTFGIASLGLSFLLFLYGMRLVSKNRSNKPVEAPKTTLWYDDHRFHKTLWVTLFWVIWGSTAIGWISNPNNPSLFWSNLAGVVGAQLASMLNDWLHIAFPILWLFLGGAFLFIVHHVAFRLPKLGKETEAQPVADPTPRMSWLKRLFERKQAVTEEFKARNSQEGADF